MKQLFIISGKNYFFKNLTNTVKKWIFLPALLIFLTMNQLSAQSIMGLNAYLGKLDPGTAGQMKSLMADLRSTAFLSQGRLTTYGLSGPVVTRCDAASVRLLYKKNPLFQQVELLRFEIMSPDELSLSLDLNRLQSFTNLRYILVEFAYDACGGKSESCLANLVANRIKGGKSPVVVLCKLSMID